MKRLVFLFLLAIFLPACSSGYYPGLPELPRKDWLGEKTGSAASDDKDLGIYSPDKTMTLEDLVWLAVYQSPVISRGSINLEVQEIQKRDAKWRYLPEMHLLYTISNNVTKYNENKPNVGENYGEPAYQLSFNGVFNNPVATYFSVQAQDELMDVAIITQRKAIGEMIYKLASCLIQIDRLNAIIAFLQTSMDNAQKRLNAARLRETQTTNLYNPASYVEDSLAELELRSREARANLLREKTRVKQLVGLERSQELKIDANSVNKLLSSFDPEKLDWRECWDKTEDFYLLRQQTRLERANVMLAWAQYMPNISIAVNESAPNGQSQPTDGQTDQFLHLTFDLPLLDWGHRWRNADIARARERQAKLDEIQRGHEYGEQWLGYEEDSRIAQASLERWRLAAKNSEKRAQAMNIAASTGSVPYDNLYDTRQREIEAKINEIDAQAKQSQTKLSWMRFSALLTSHFIGPAGIEKAKK